MERTPLQRAAAGWCLFAAGLLTVYQIVPALDDPPLHLYLVFTGVWLFGAAMLWWAPLFGAVGTTLYGLLLGTRLLQAHEVRMQNVVLALVFLVGSVVAGAFLVQRVRAMRQE